MRALFVFSDAQWSGSARVFVAAARGLAARGYQVTAACQPETAAEQRLASSGVETVPVELDGMWRGAARRLRRVLEDRFVEVVFNSTPLEVRPASVVLEVAGQRREIGNDYVWVFAGGTPPAAFLEKIGVQVGARTVSAA